MYKRQPLSCCDLPGKARMSFNNVVLPFAQSERVQGVVRGNMRREREKERFLRLREVIKN